MANVLYNAINSIRQFFRKNVKVPYYYIPPCPACHGMSTGQYVKLHRDYVADWMIDEALMNGEIIKPVAEIPPKNCYCMICGYEWTGRAETKFFNALEIEEQKQLRQTTSLLNIRKEGEKQKKENLVTSFFTRRMKI